MNRTQLSQVVLDRLQQYAALPVAPGTGLPVLGPVSLSTNSQGRLDRDQARTPHPRHPAQEIGWKLRPLALAHTVTFAHFNHTPRGNREAPWSHAPWWRFGNSKVTALGLHPSQIRASLLLQISLIPQQRQRI